MEFAEYMFVNTIDDIKETLARGKPYFLIRGAGLLRHLILDSTPLIDLVNRSHKLDITYRVVKPLEGPKKGTDLSKIYFSMNNLYLLPNMPPVPVTEYTQVKRQQFLQLKCFNFDGHLYTVRDVIDFTSHIRHGVHSGRAKTPMEKAFIEVNELSLVRALGVDTHGRTLSDLLNIVIEATLPLYDKIIESPTA